MLGRRRIEEDNLVYFKQLTCEHGKQELYTQRSFDILKGFELVYTRCLNCHKIVSLEVRKLANR
jgi:hypothetical protein